MGRRWLIDMDQFVPKNNSHQVEEADVEMPFLTYIKDSEHEYVFLNYLNSVKKSLYIATCNFKNVYFNGVELATILNKLANKGTKVVVKCMKPHGHDKVKQDFDLIVCDRNHMKLFIFDEKILYIGSANLTGAAIGRTENSRRAFNYEAGILTTNPNLIKQALEHFNQVGQKVECEVCKKKRCKYRI